MKRRMALFGAALGLGSPIGCLALRLLHWHYADIRILNALPLEWAAGTYYYVYMAVSTVIAFGLFGYVLGRYDDALARLTIIDHLTQIYNHRYLQEQLAAEIARSDRTHGPVTCLMIDVDNFKTVNDRLGHPFGDHVLSTIARTIKEAVRRVDCVGRYGGEEFLVIMPQTAGLAAQAVADRVLGAVRGSWFGIEGQGVSVTVSIGLATYPSPDIGINSKEGLIAASDKALYQAKRAGKNRSVVWNGAQ